MDKKAFIWDLDGTLLDSYGVIVSSLREAFRELGTEFGAEEIQRYVIRYSVSAFIKDASRRCGAEPDEAKRIYSRISGERQDEIGLMPGAFETLERLAGQGALNFVFTHRGASSFPILERLGIKRFFGEIVTGADGFARKPSPEALEHLIEKHSLERGLVYYVGDRSIDMECAENAGVKGILFLPEGSFGERGGKESRVIEKLIETAEL